MGALLCLLSLNVSCSLINKFSSQGLQKIFGVKRKSRQVDLRTADATWRLFGISLQKMSQVNWLLYARGILQPRDALGRLSKDPIRDFRIQQRVVRTM